MKKKMFMAVALAVVFGLSACKGDSGAVAGTIDSQGNAVAANPEQQSEFEEAAKDFQEIIDNVDQLTSSVTGNEPVDVTGFYGEMDLSGKWKADGFEAEGTATGDDWYSFVITRLSDNATWTFEGKYDVDMGALQYEGIFNDGKEELNSGGALSKNDDSLNWFDSMLDDGVLLNRVK